MQNKEKFKFEKKQGKPCKIRKNLNLIYWMKWQTREGVSYETAGSLQGGQRTWILAKLPQSYMISGDEVTPYLVFMNSHDGTGAIKAAMTPVRAA